MTQPIIQLDAITKRFGGVTALDRVGFSIEPGEVHAVVGENGAGKSTLMKILAAAQAPDGGRILLRGRPVRMRGPLDARRAGISIVYQELNLFPHRSVAANIFANRELVGPLGLLNRRAMRDAARRTLADMGVGGIDPDAPVGRLTLGERQFVEIARALQQRADVVILDEPNSALGEQESRRLFEIVRRLRAEQGVTFIYVSHRLEEVFAIADRITVLRDGRYQGTEPIAATNIPAVISKMVGRRLEEAFGRRDPPAELSPVALRVDGLCGGGGRPFGPVSFEARAGEIVGFAGLEGAGVDSLFRALFGLEPAAAGRVALHDRPQRLRSPLAAIRQGWGLVPASRRDQGLFMAWSIRRNAALLVLRDLSNRLGLIDRRRSRELAAEYVSRLNVATDGVEELVMHLSGGNQQKVLLAKWLATGPRVLILNDPTRGVDVGAKAEIYRLCADLAARGLVLLFSSSELEETIGLCDRILVMHRGRVLREFRKGDVTKAELMHAVSGAAADTSRAESGKL